MNGPVIVNLSGSYQALATTLSWNTAQTVQSTFVSNGSFSQPDVDVSQLEVVALGGGAGGGAGPAPSSQGYGGYGGAYANAFFSPGALTYPVSVTIGVGGSGATGPTWNSTGAPGTDTIFGTYITAHGGTFYPNPTATAVVTGATSSTTESGGGYNSGGGLNADTTHAGAGGGATQGTGLPPQTVRGGICSAGPGGNGGNSPGPQGNGGNGAGFGSGGGGGTGSPTFNGSGGNGTNGAVIVTQTYASPADSYDVYRDGTLIGNTAGTVFDDQNPPAGAHTYRVVAVISGVEQPGGGQQITITVQPTTINLGGKFVPSPVYKAVEVGQVGDIKPRIWPAKKNNTVHA